jgi:lipid-A-disaccharide synthase
VKVRFANLINLMAGRAIIPEFLLWECRAETIAQCVLDLLNSPAEAEKQIADAHDIMQRLRLPNILPSNRAMQVVMETISKIKR